MPRHAAQRVLWRFSDTAAAHPSELCVHELVAAQAARTPAAVALEWKGDALAYAALEACAASVAAWLRARAERPGSIRVLTSGPRGSGGHGTCRSTGEIADFVAVRPGGFRARALERGAVRGRGAAGFRGDRAGHW